jgi:hypothetical protein
MIDTSTETFSLLCARFCIECAKNIPVDDKYIEIVYLIASFVKKITKKCSQRMRCNMSTDNHMTITYENLHKSFDRAYDIYTAFDTKELRNKHKPYRLPLTLRYRPE